MPSNAQPYEVIAGPIEVYRAPVLTAFPAIDESPAVDWVLLGVNGSKNYAESGVIVRHPNEITTFNALGRTGPVKNWRTNEGLEIELVLHDFTAEAYAMALNKETTDIVDTPAAAGVVGDRRLPLTRGVSIPSFALLLRCGMSPYGDGWNSQFEIPLAQNVGAPELVFNKTTPVGMQFIFRCLEDAALGFGSVRFQDADAI